MLRRIAYRDEEYGEILVPADPGTFETDFASVPTLLTWLVPRTGAHLPAALIHDGLVGDKDYVAAPGEIDTGGRRPGLPTGDARQRHPADPALAGLVGGDARAPSGTAPRAGPERSTFATCFAAFGSLLLVAALGIAATLDLFDVVAWLPWMGADRGFVLELVGGLAGAIVVPLLLGLTWGRFAIAGAVTGIALAVLLHVTALLLAVTALYQARRAGGPAYADRRPGRDRGGAGRQPAADGAAGRHVRLRGDICSRRP